MGEKGADGSRAAALGATLPTPLRIRHVCSRLGPQYERNARSLLMDVISPALRTVLKSSPALFNRPIVRGEIISRVLLVRRESMLCIIGPW